MRALVCRELGPVEKLVLEEDYPLPTVGADGVQIKVKSAGMNFPDTLMIEGKYQIKPELPFIPGYELSGIVEAVGSNVSRFKPGDNVIAMVGYGAFCTQLVADQKIVYPMPGNLSFSEAAGIGITYFTGYHAYKQRAKLKPGETVLVLGAGGGVGVTAVELAKAMGAKVIAAASTTEKLELAKIMGADELINYDEQPLKETVKALTGGRGVDVVYDPVGGDYSEQALRCMAWKGRFLVIGFAAGPIPKIPLNLALLKGCDIVGVFWGSFKDQEPEIQQQNVDELWGMFEKGLLKPVVTDKYPLQQYKEGFDCLLGRRAKGKVILEIG